MKKKAKAMPGRVEPDVISFDTFRKMPCYTLEGMKQAEPSCFNGSVSVRKYRVTTELIDEPIEVIHERLKKLWAECRNHHHWEPLKAEAKKYGLELTHER